MLVALPCIPHAQAPCHGGASAQKHRRAAQLEEMVAADLQQVLNQAVNDVRAVSLRAICGFGRAVTDVWTKLVSFALIAAGLALSAVS